jgi:hypothetical protein
MKVLLTSLIITAILIFYTKLEIRINQRACPQCQGRISVDDVPHICPLCGTRIAAEVGAEGGTEI